MRLQALVSAVVLIVGASTAAQKATEMLIPIGQSPGDSGIASVVGVIASCDSTAVQIAADAGTTQATLSAETKIWLDGSAARRPNAVGTLADCQKGRRAEVKFVYEGQTRTTRAEWIKIAVP